jgi:hypothetical protein
MGAQAPSKTLQVEVATRYANEGRGTKDSEPVALTYEQVAWLKRRPQFKEFVEKLETDGLAAARELIIQSAPSAIEARTWAIQHAKQSEDHRAMAQLTEAYFDRALPKKPELLVAQQVVTIQLTAEQLAGIEEEAIPVTCELIDAGAPEPAKQIPSPRTSEELYRSTPEEPQLMTYTQLLRDPRYRDKLPQRGPR